MKLRRTHLVDLAERACVAALERWGGDRRDVTHLLWGTMTGAMDSPTIDIQLAKVCNSFVLVEYGTVCDVFDITDTFCIIFIEPRLGHECRTD